MFALFFSLYWSMFTGNWRQFSLDAITTNIETPFNVLGNFITSIFGEFQVTNLGTNLSSYGIISVVAFILALITSIGIVVMAVKGVKKAFGIFFMGIR